MATLAYERRYALNAICPYFTTFPLEYPLGILNTFRNKPVVLDPFCGRGTTLYSARESGLQSYGIDSSPIAITISKAKLSKVNPGKIIGLAEQLLARSPLYIPQTPFFRYAFSAQTLKEICSIREGLKLLDHETDESCVLKALMIGCLHGPLNKTVDSLSYFSNQMPRTFSPKPGYSVKFWNSKMLVPPILSVTDVISRKLKRMPKHLEYSHNHPRNVFYGDSRNAATFDNIPNDYSVVITSPPYFGMRTYLQDQWLRHWFLGGPDSVDYSVKNQIDHKNEDVFINSLSAVWQNVHKSKSSSLDLFIRFGSIPSAKCDAINVLRQSLDLSGGWRILSISNAGRSGTGRRQATQMKCSSETTSEFDFHIIRS